MFSCKCFILNTKKSLEKFDVESDELIFFGCFTSNKAYHDYSRRILVVKEFIHIVFDGINPFELGKGEDCFADMQKKMDYLRINDIQEENSEEKLKEKIKKDDPSEEQHNKLFNNDQKVKKITHDLPKEWKYVKGHPRDLVVGDPSYGVKRLVSPKVSKPLQL